MIKFILKNCTDEVKLKNILKETDIVTVLTYDEDEILNKIDDKKETTGDSKDILNPLSYV